MTSKKEERFRDLTEEEEAMALEKLKDSSALYHQSAGLSTVTDALAAMSCEMLKANVAGLSSVDAGAAKKKTKKKQTRREEEKGEVEIRKETFSKIADVSERHGATALDSPGRYYDVANQGGELPPCDCDLI